MPAAGRLAAKLVVMVSILEVRGCGEIFNLFFLHFVRVLGKSHQDEASAVVKLKKKK